MRRFSTSGPALALPLLVACLFASTPALAQDAPIPPGTNTAEGVVHELYDMCTFDAGTVPDWEGPPQPGVDFIQLIRNDGRWWIVSIANEIPTPNRPVPEALKGGSN